MSKKLFLEAVNIGAACLAPGLPERHLVAMLAKRLEPLREDHPELIKLILPEPKPGLGKAVVTINGFWLARFCTSLYDGLYMLELEAVEHIPPPPPERAHRPALTIRKLMGELSGLMDDTVLENIEGVDFAWNDEGDLRVTLKIKEETDEVYFDRS